MEGDGRRRKVIERGHVPALGLHRRLAGDEVDARELAEFGLGEGEGRSEKAREGRIRREKVG